MVSVFSNDVTIAFGCRIIFSVAVALRDNCHSGAVDCCDFLFLLQDSDSSRWCESGARGECSCWCQAAWVTKRIGASQCSGIRRSTVGVRLGGNTSGICAERLQGCANDLQLSQPSDVVGLFAPRSFAIVFPFTVQGNRAVLRSAHGSRIEEPCQ